MKNFLSKVFIISALLVSGEAYAVNTTLPLLTAGSAVSAGDLFLTRQGSDTSDKKITGTQLRTFALLGNATSATTAGTLTTALLANQVLGSLTAVAPTGLSIPSCSTSASALLWTSGSGFSCNTSVVAASTTGNAATVTNGVYTTDTGSVSNTMLAGSVALSKLATQATNTVVGNATSGSASPTALAVGTCSTSGSALNWTTNTGFGCNTSIVAASATTATNATNSAITDDTSTNATMLPTWVTANTGNLPLKTTSTKLTFNPSTGVLSSTSFTGAGTGLTGTGASFTAGNVTTDANLTGPITSSGNATSIAAQTGTGTTFVTQTSPSLTTPNINVATGTSLVLTGTSSTILAVGPAGTSNPVLQVDASVSSQATGVSIQGKAAGTSPSITSISSGSNEGISLAAKGTGNVSLMVQGAAKYLISNSGTTHTLSVLTSGTASNVRFGFTGAADTAMTASTEAPSVYFNMGQIRQHAQGALTLQRDMRITGSTHSFATGAATLTDAAAFSIDGADSAGTNATITNSHGLYIPTIAVTGTVTNADGISVAAPTGGGTTNYAIKATGSSNIDGVISGGTKFTITGCSADTTVGGATAGTFVSRTTGVCNVTITMNGVTGMTAPTGWSCWASDRTTPANLYDQNGGTATTATFTGTTVTGDVINFGCVGY